MKFQEYFVHRELHGCKEQKSRSAFVATVPVVVGTTLTLVGGLIKTSQKRKLDQTKEQRLPTGRRICGESYRAQRLMQYFSAGSRF